MVCVVSRWHSTHSGAQEVMCSIWVQGRLLLPTGLGIGVLTALLVCLLVVPLLLQVPPSTMVLLAT